MFAIKNRKKYIYYSLSSISAAQIPLIGATYIIYLQDKGFPLDKISFINLVFTLSIALTDLPTGVLADKYGRKLSVVLSYLFWCLSMYLYSLAYSFIILIIAELFAGLYISLLSGSLEAWIVDELKDTGMDSKELSSIFGMSRSLMIISALMGAMIGGLIPTLNVSYPFLLSSLLGFLGFIISGLFLKEDNRSRIEDEKRYFDMFKESISFFKGNNALMFLTFGMTCAWMGDIVLDFLWQPLSKQFGASLSDIGNLFILKSIVVLPAPYLSSKLMKKGAIFKKNVFIFGIVSGILMYFLFFILKSKSYIFLIIIYVITMFSIEFRTPSYLVWRNELILNRLRASLISFQSTLVYIGGAISWGILGWLSKYYTGYDIKFLYGFLMYILAFLFSIRSHYIHTKLNDQGGLII